MNFDGYCCYDELYAEDLEKYGDEDVLRKYDEQLEAEKKRKEQELLMEVLRDVNAL